MRESGEPVIRAAMMQAMRIMGEQFVLGRNVKDALKRGGRMVRQGDAAHFSFDMLGEGARTAADAERYLKAYQSAIEQVAASKDKSASSRKRPMGVSVKLSALHPRYEAVNRGPRDAGDLSRSAGPLQTGGRRRTSIFVSMQRKQTGWSFP